MHSRPKKCISAFNYVGMLRFDGSSITYSDLKASCRKILDLKSATDIVCRHTHLKTPCIMRGTRDGSKAPCIRRCFLEDRLEINLNEGGCISKSLSHLR